MPDAPTRDHAISAARAFAKGNYPAAEIVFLGGSWATDTAHEDSDLDLVIIDDTAETVSFEGTPFNEFVVEVCVLPSKLVKSFFHDSADFRSAPVPPQVATGLVIIGSEEAASPLRKYAKAALLTGPTPISLEEKAELRWELSELLSDLIHAGPDTVISISAVAHNALSKAILDLNCVWRADRKSLKKAVAKLDPDFSAQLDAAMASACEGISEPMIKQCRLVLEQIGGPSRIYPRFTP